MVDIRLDQGLTNPNDIQLSDPTVTLFTEGNWHQPLSQPRPQDFRTKAFAVALIASGVTQVVGPVPGSGDVAFASTNTIVPHSRTLLYPAVQGPVLLAAATEVVTVDKYYKWLSEPARMRLGLPAYDQLALALVKADPFPEAVSIDRWQQALSVPTKLRLLSTSAQPFAAFIEAAPFAETVSADRWQQAFSTPVLRRGQSQQAAAFFVGSDTATDARWLAPLSEPTRRKPTSQPDALTWSYFTPAAAVEVVTVDKYYNWLSEPVRVRPGLPFYDQQALAFVPQQPISGSGDVAFASTNTIVPYLRVLLYPAVQEPVSLAIASGEVVTVDKYYNWLSEPLRGRGYKVFQQVEPPFVGSDTATDARWFVFLSDPGRRKAAIQPDGLSWSYFTSAVEVVTVDKYYNWLAEPVRFPRAMAAYQQPYFSFVKAAPFAETVSIDRWLQQLSQPTLRLVSVAGHPFAAWSAFTPQPVVVLAREWIIKARRRGRR